MKKNTLIITLLSLLLIFTSFTFSSCSDNSEPSYSSFEITGTWTGTRAYYNPAAGYKYQYLYVTFNSDGTGKIEYEAPNSYSIGYFTYSIAGNRISCLGARGISTGDIDPDFRMEMEIRGDRIIPLDKYTVFILTKDGSVITDGDGNEVIDQSGLIYGVWINRDGMSVVEFLDNGVYTEYVLDASGSNSYTSVNYGEYSYDAVRKCIDINYSCFDIIDLTADYMVLESLSGNVFYYDRGSVADIPTSLNTAGALAGNVWSTKNGQYSFAFHTDGTVVYFEVSDRNYGSYGHISLRATGLYSVSGENLVCKFTDVSWHLSGTYPNAFPGWTADAPVTKNYRIIVVPGSSLTVTDSEGKTMYMDML